MLVFSAVAFRSVVLPVITQSSKTTYRKNPVLGVGC